ncbi:InlB B-repeat-containing protein [Bacillus sp. FJAT-28004]|uniref:InlB B-repeat-containing protein n=1 Tax=Bacillus sp. FJAT-28004 TaxID=1679165 RepID=UPI0006B52D79|nr:InlB B-repeat-containing protein [Bacillus sp. FJAT-28004]
MKTKRRLLSMILALCYLVVTLTPTPYVAAAEVTGTPKGNLAHNANVTGSKYDSSGQSSGNWWGGAPFSLKNITSGTLNTDLWVAPGANGTPGTPGNTASSYLLIDLGTEKMMNVVKIWNYFRNHPASGLRTYHNQIVQLSTDGSNWVNVFNQDVNNVAHQDPKDSNKTFANGTLVNESITGVSAGNDAEYQEDTTAGGHQIEFEPTTARYIRWWVGGMTGELSNNNIPQMVQLQAYYMNTITYDYNDGINPSTTVKAINDTVLTKPSDPVSQTLGQVFDKWTVDVVGGTAWDFLQPVTGDMKLVANWKAVSVYTVKFSSGENAEPITVEVTEGDRVTPPEGLIRDGMVLVGWELNGVPFDFSTPITSEIILTAIWVPVPSADASVIPAGLLNIVLNSAGQITNLINTLDGTDYATTSPDGKTSYLMSLIVNYAPHYPTAVHYTKGSGKLTFDFASIKGKATVNVEEKGGYTTFTLTDLKLPSELSAQAVLWGPIKVDIKSGGQVAGVAYNDNFGLGIHSLNNKTIGGWPVEYNNLSYPSDLPNVNGYPHPLNTRGFNNIAAAFNTWGSALQAYTWDYTKPTKRKVQEWNAASPTRTIPALTGDYAGDASIIGSSIALYGTRTPNILNVLSNIEVNEGLPHPTINGEWQKTSLETAQDFLVFTDNMYNNIDNDSKMALDSGINYIYGQYGASGPWITDGGYQFNGNFGGSDAAAKQMVDIAASYGIKVGVHTLSNEISPGDRTYMNPLANAGLASAGIANLTRAMSDTDTTVYIDNGKEFSPDFVGAAGSNSVLIDNEIIAFSGSTKVSDNEWQLTGVVRGYRGTTVSAHDEGTSAKLLFFYYDRYIADIELNKQMTGRMADIFNNLGVHAMSYDALEATKMTTYGALNFGAFPISVYNGINAANKDGFITEASDMGSNLWNVTSRISWGESDTPINLINNYLEFYGQNFFPKMIGWTYTHGGHGASDEPNLLMNLAMKAGWDAGTGWYVTANTFKQRPYMAKEIKLWNNAIKHGAFVVGGEFTSEVQADMRKAWSNGKAWKLTEVVPDQQWTLQQVTKDNNFTPIGNAITLNATNDINVVQSANGDIATSTSLNYSRAHSGDTVTIYPQAYSGFQLDEATLTVTGAGNIVYPITAKGDGTYTFQMPSLDVTITAQFNKEIKNGNPNLTATGDASVIAGQSFDVTYALSSVTESVYALDQTIHYDPTQLEILSVDALKSGFSVIGQKEGLGQVRILMASTEAGSAITDTTNVLKLHFKAKAVGQNVTSSVYLSDVAVAGANGNEITVNNGEAYTIQIIAVDKSVLQALITSVQASHDAAVEGTGIGMYPVGKKAILQAAIDNAKTLAGQGGATQEQVDQAIEQLEEALKAFVASVNVPAAGDLNRDGKFSISDLALIAASYGTTSTDSVWNPQADMNNDGKIDIVDLAAIARLILG